MNVISFIATKSMGKSTNLHVLAERLLKMNVPVHIIDADPQSSQAKFVSEAQEHYSTLSFTPWEVLNATQEPAVVLYDTVEQKAEEQGVLLIDVQGSDNDLLTQGASLADLVLVPMVDGPLEREATKATFKRLKMLERMLKRKLNAKIYYAAVPPFGLSKVAQSVIDQAAQIDFEFLGSHLMARREFKYLCETGTLNSARPEVLKIADTWQKAVGEALL